MLSSERHSHLAPFPRLPASVQIAPAIDGLILRPFGLFHCDLEVDFNQYSRPRMVTQILRCCTASRDGKAPDQAFFWSLSSGKRIECLVAIATLGDPSGLSVRLRCPDETCRQEMEVEVSIQELADLQRRSDETDRFLVRLGDEKVPVRVPTGRDQQDWLEASFDNEDAALKTVIETLLIGAPPSLEDGSVPEDWVQPINAVLEELDPLVNFVVLARCPECETENRYEIDLQNMALGMLHRDQLRLLRAVHRLALHYHWSEEQIFDLPPWRYSHYLALIEREKIR